MNFTTIRKPKVPKVTNPARSITVRVKKPSVPKVKYLTLVKRK